MNLVQEQINHYSELMAKLEGAQYANTKYNRRTHRFEDYTPEFDYHNNRNSLHRVWEKFRDLKLGEDEYYNHALRREQIGLTIIYRTHEEAFLELGKGLEWLETLKK